MTRILITGATGNVGNEVIKALETLVHDFDIYAGVRDPIADKAKLANYNIRFLAFDFTNINTIKPALEGCDILFLLRPPQISEVAKYFKPIIDTCIQTGVKHIIFLSVQGVEKSSIIPHHKIEKLIVESKIPYTFLRPAYFMQNFTTTLQKDLVRYKQIYLPAGNARFTLVDLRDIGTVAAHVIANISQHQNTAYELTCAQLLTFKEMAAKLTNQLGIKITFNSPNLMRFYWTKRMENMPPMLILVMIMLHYLPRFQKKPAITDWVEKITGKKPIAFEQFIDDYKKQLTELI